MSLRYTLFRKFFITLLQLVVATLLSFLSVYVEADGPDIIAVLKKYIETGQFQEAYRLATEEFYLHAGEPEFDYLYGLSAMRAGKRSEASFAFERVLINNPRHTEAREYFYKLRPTSRQSRYQLLASVGSDSNINDATSNAHLLSFLPFLGDFKLPTDGKEQSDNFFRFIAIADWQHKLASPHSFFMRASFEQQENLSSHAFDRSTYFVQGGLIWQKESYALRYPVIFEALYYDNTLYRLTSAIGIEYLPNNVWDKRYPFSYFMDVGGLRFHRASYKDVDFVSIGVRGYAGTPFQTLNAIADLYVGAQHNRHHRGRHHGNKNGGLRGKISWNMTPRQDVLFSLSYERDNYNAPNPIYNKERVDDIFRGSLGWEWHFRPSLVWEVLFSYKRADSNLSMFDHKRTVVETGVHYQF